MAVIRLYQQNAASRKVIGYMYHSTPFALKAAMNDNVNSGASISPQIILRVRLIALVASDQAFDAAFGWFCG